MALSGLQEIPQEFVYLDLDHKVQLSGLNKFTQATDK